MAPPWVSRGLVGVFGMGGGGPKLGGGLVSPLAVPAALLLCAGLCVFVCDTNCWVLQGPQPAIPWGAHRCPPQFDPKESESGLRYCLLYLLRPGHQNTAPTPGVG